jgi:hypothetical protein
MKDKEAVDELQGSPTINLPVQLNTKDILTAPVAPTNATANAVEENNPANPEAELEAEPKLEEAKPEPKAEAKPELEPELEEAKSEVKPEAKSEVKPEAKLEPEVKAEPEENNPSVINQKRKKAKPTVKGGRILHSRKMKSSI